MMTNLLLANLILLGTIVLTAGAFVHKSASGFPDHSIAKLLTGKRTVSKFHAAGSSKSSNPPKVRPGWAQISHYLGGCDGDPFVVYGLKTNVCFNVYYQSFLVTCGAMSGGFNMYSGSDCRPENLMNRTVATDYNKCVTDENGMSSRSFCTSDGSQLPLGAGEWFTTHGTTNSGCNDTVEIVGHLNKRCFSNDGRSRKYDFPKVFTYKNGDCSGDPAATSEIKGNVCKRNSIYDYINYYAPSSGQSQGQSQGEGQGEVAAKGGDQYYYSGGGGGEGGGGEGGGEGGGDLDLSPLIPTDYEIYKLVTVAKPPPLNPVKDASMKFSVSQTINGVSATQYNADKAKNDKIMQKTVASKMPGVAPTDITIQTVKDVAAAAVLPVVVSLRSLATSSLSISYDVNIPSTSNAGYNDESQAYNATITSLQNSLQDGSFDAQLVATATEIAGASSPLTTATAATTVTYSTYTAETISSDSGSDSSSSDSSLSAGAIAGIVIGAVCFLGLLIAAFYFMSESRNSVKPTSTIKPNTAVVQPA